MDKSVLYEKIVKGRKKGIGINKKLYPEFFDDKRRNELLNNPIHKDYLEEIKQVAGAYRNQEIKVLPWHLFREFEKTGNRIEYEKVYFDHRGRLMSFALMSWLYHKTSYIELLEDIIWAVCDEYTWALPAHLDLNSLESTSEVIYKNGELIKVGFEGKNDIDLFAAETAFALSEIIYMLEEYLSPIVVQRARREIFSRVLLRYIEFAGQYSWESMKNNWCAVCAGSIGIAGIYLLDDDELLAELLDRLGPTLERFLDSFEDDGTCLEGLSYWTYGVSFFVAFADLLNRRTAGEVDLIRTERFKKIATFQQKCYFPGGWTVSFSDANRKDRYRTGLTCYLKECFKEVQMPPYSSKAGYSFDSCFRWCHGIRDLLWTNDYLGAKQSSTTCDILPNAEWMLCKQFSGKQISLAVKGGHNKEPHNHNDVGSFILYKDGECILTDLGSGEYTKDYFGEGRYSIFCNSSLGHSVPIINGNGQKEGRQYASKDLIFHDDGRMIMDIAGAYGIINLTKLVRDITFHEDKVILIDSFQVKKGIQYIKERFITLHKPIIMKDSVVIKTGNTDCVIRYFDKDIKPTVELHNHKDHDGQQVTVYCIDFDKLVDKENVICRFEIK